MDYDSLIVPPCPIHMLESSWGQAAEKFFISWPPGWESDLKCQFVIIVMAVFSDTD